ncbi:unnamed protein product [Periconia digitata]|uniref:Uncharacterized protein n=1 Tax=Periconia digitata TaxID=1303443 RepID=A0A9W4U225_9PLEO|nr:unnamed protein product [Periconia digitata]
MEPTSGSPPCTILTATSAVRLYQLGRPQNYLARSCGSGGLRDGQRARCQPPAPRKLPQSPLLALAVNPPPKPACSLSVPCTHRTHAHHHHHQSPSPPSTTTTSLQPTRNPSRHRHRNRSMQHLATPTAHSFIHGGSAHSARRRRRLLGRGPANGANRAA